MSYLLIGNISALICEECIEPLSSARIRIYLPCCDYDAAELARGIFKDLQLLPGADVSAKADRLLAEAVLDERGNFKLSWEGAHLFTEPLEMDICLNNMPGTSHWSQFHLSTFVPHWKRSREKYLAAFAYVVPSVQWNKIRSSFGSWVISGAVRHYDGHEALPNLRVEAYNALNDRLLATAVTNPAGRYKLHFSQQEFSSGGEDAPVAGPDVYFKIYAGEQLVWSESKDMALLPGRRQVASCSRLNLFIRPSIRIPRKPIGISGWLTDLISTKKESDYKDLYVY